MGDPPVGDCPCTVPVVQLTASVLLGDKATDFYNSVAAEMLHSPWHFNVSALEDGWRVGLMMHRLSPLLNFSLGNTMVCSNIICASS